jgi:hypothetical protein
MMRALNMKSHWGSAAGVVGVGALLLTVGCGTRDAGTVAAQQVAANQAGTPVVVTCEPHQRTVVRPAVVNGAAVSQVECVAAQPAAYAQAPVAAPIPASQYAYAPAPVYAPPRTVARPVYTDYSDTQIVQAPAPRRTVARPVRTSQVVYDEIPVRKKRSVKKSAIIIGSSAGAGAGIGAAVGGKKGALIGAAIGGGGAAVWDQITRRR